MRKLEKALWLVPVFGYLVYLVSGIIDLTGKEVKVTNQALGYAITKYHSFMFILGIATYLIWATWDK